MEIDVFAFSRMILDHTVLSIPENVFHKAHFGPCWSSLNPFGNTMNADMLPSGAVTRDDEKACAGIPLNHKSAVIAIGAIGRHIAFFNSVLLWYFKHS